VRGDGADDLRSFLERLRRERPGDVVDVRREVSPRHETAAILARLEERFRSPVLVFHRVRGSLLPVVTNVCGTVARLALALGCRVADLAERYARACERPVPPVFTGEAPVQEIVRTGADVDLSFLPALVYHEHDAPNPWITAAIVAARDPDSGTVNLSYHRLMVDGKDRTSIYMEPGKHLDRIRLRHEAAGHEMPIAAFIGAHPAWSVGACFTGSPDVEEYAIAGGLVGEPVALARCVTQPSVPVPARAEIVLEGVVPPAERLEEGPFGEFTGHATGTMAAPVFRVTAITSRRDPLFQDVVSGSFEHLLLPSLGIERHALEVARKAVPGVAAARLLAPLTIAVSLRKRDDGEPWRVIEALLDSDVYTKHVVVVDEDVSAVDARQVWTAVALRVQADRGVRIYPGRRGTPLDPSADSADGRTAKMGIDATTPLRPARPLTRNSIPREVLESVDLRAILGEGLTPRA
jgi:2,5-furandicarboxylate decarboxylase 1